MAKTKREPISKKVRFEILKRDKFTCRYCGAKAPEVLLHIEHIKPVSKGGTNDYENLIAACESCNSGKGARLLTDQTAIAKSRDLLEKSQAEIEQLEEMIRWRKTIANKKSKQRDYVLNSLEEIADATFTEYGRENILKAYNKHGFDVCADHISSYLEWCDKRKEQELSLYTFSQYINYQSKRDTLEGRIRYFLGIVRKTTSARMLNNISTWIRKAEISEGFAEELIQSVKELHPDDTYISEDKFVEWWHKHVWHEFGSCCEMHKNAGFYYKWHKENNYE